MYRSSSFEDLNDELHVNDSVNDDREGAVGHSLVRLLLRLLFVAVALLRVVGG